MKVFVKRYPSKGELPKESRIYTTNVGAIHYLHPFQRWLDNEPQWWMQEIELPSEEGIRVEALGPFKEKDLEDQYGDFIQDDINTFTKGANYILNLLRTKT